MDLVKGGFWCDATFAKKKETTMSQMTSLLKALKHCEKVSVLVATATVAVRNAHAPVGSGASTRPARQPVVLIRVWRRGRL